MNVHNMILTAKPFLLKFHKFQCLSQTSSVLSWPLFLYISGSFPNTGDIVTVRAQNVRMDTEVGGSWEGKRHEGWEKGYKKRKTKKVSTYMDGM